MKRNIYDSDKENEWCPGCGNFGILNALKDALVELGIPPHKVLFVAGIGQAAKTPHFLKCNLFHGLHGRALPVAAGAKMANRDLTVLVSTGDGDCYGEGGNHFINAIRRNMDLTVLVHNNKVYGLTKGQASPTSDTGMITKAQPQGVSVDSFNPLAIAIALNAGFVARGYVGYREHLCQLVQKAVRHRGFSLVDVLQVCVSFNHDNTYDWYNDRVYDLAEANHDSLDASLALERAREWGKRIPIGVFFQKDTPISSAQLSSPERPPLVDQPYDPGILRDLLKNLYD